MSSSDTWEIGNGQIVGVSNLLTCQSCAVLCCQSKLLLNFRSVLLLFLVIILPPETLWYDAEGLATQTFN